MDRRAALSALLAFGTAPGAFAQSGRRATVAALLAFPSTEPMSRRRLEAFVNSLAKHGWREGQNLRLEVRHAQGEAALQRAAAELAALEPAVMFVQTNVAMAAVRKQGISLPTVFVAVSDPVGGGYVASLARPGGNATGFANFAPEIGAKWLEVLRELSPRTDRVVMLLNPAVAANREMAEAAASAGAAVGVATTAVSSGDSAALESARAGLSDKRRGGLIVMPNPANTQNQKHIIETAGRHGIPAIYPFSYYVRNGGLAAYGIDLVEQFRLAAGYVDRILRGAKPADLPVQQPAKYELVINLRTAKALGLSVPGTLLARADEVVE